MIGFETLAAIAGTLASLIALGFMMVFAKKAGRDAEKAEKAENDAQLQMEFDKIDSRAPDLDSAIARLRDRGKRSSTTPK